MAFTQDDLQSAAAKLATLDFTPAELEAIASTIRGHASAEPAEVAGFAVFEPNDEPMWNKGFIPEVAGLMRMPGKGYTDAGPARLNGLLSTETGETI